MHDTELIFIKQSITNFKKKYIKFVGGFPGGSAVKNLPAKPGDAEDTVSIPGSGRSLGRRNGNQLQYSCLENSMDRGAWQATVHGVKRVRCD